MGSRKDFITYRRNSKKVCIEQSLYNTESYHYGSSVHIPWIFFSFLVVVFKKKNKTKTLHNIWNSQNLKLTTKPSVDY